MQSCSRAQQFELGRTEFALNPKLQTQRLDACAMIVGVGVSGAERDAKTALGILLAELRSRS